MAKVVNEDVYKAIDAVNKQIQAIVKAGEKGTINVSLIMQDYVNVIHSVIPASMDKFILLDTAETPRTYPIQISNLQKRSLHFLQISWHVLKNCLQSANIEKKSAERLLQN